PRVARPGRPDVLRRPALRERGRLLAPREPDPRDVRSRLQLRTERAPRHPHLDEPDPELWPLRPLEARSAPHPRPGRRAREPRAHPRLGLRSGDRRARRRARDGRPRAAGERIRLAAEALSAATPRRRPRPGRSVRSASATPPP